MQVRSCFPHRSSTTFVLAGVLALSGAVSSGADDKPSINVKANPTVGFSPARVILTAELKGGANDYEQFYCPTVEWEFSTGVGISGDGGRAEQTNDCEPYEAGKSEIKRRYVREQTFRSAGEYRVQFRLKQKDKVVGSAHTTVRIRPGAGDRTDGSIDPR